jgi:hypothetical protein
MKPDSMTDRAGKKGSNAGEHFLLSFYVFVKGGVPGSLMRRLRNTVSLRPLDCFHLEAKRTGVKDKRNGIVRGRKSEKTQTSESIPIVAGTIDQGLAIKKIFNIVQICCECFVLGSAPLLREAPLTAAAGSCC